MILIMRRLGRRRRVTAAACSVLVCMASLACAITSSVSTSDPFYETSSGFLSPFPHDLNGNDIAELEGTPPLSRVADEAWARYYEYLMAHSRSAPLAVLFTGDACGGVDEEPVFEQDPDDDEEDGEEDEAMSFITRQALVNTRTAEETCDTSHLTTIEAAVLATVREHFPALMLVRISKQELPQAWSQHALPSWPSLMWFPPRKRTFQRLAHPATNFLALSPLAAMPESTQATETTTPPLVGDAVFAFLRRCHTQNGISMKAVSLTTKRQPGGTTQTSPSVVSLFLNAIPLMALTAFAVLTAYEYRLLVVRKLQDRVIWFLAAQTVMYIALSGLMHSFLQGVPLIYVHPQYGVALIHPSGSRQFMLEGLVHGGWSFVVSMAAFSVADVLPLVRRNGSREDLFHWSLFAAGVAFVIGHLTFLSKNRWLAA